MPIINCKNCKKDFKAKKFRSGKGIRKFCSRNCSSENYRGSKLPKRSKVINYKCLNCEDIFEMKESVYRAQDRKCCSAKCASEHKIKVFALKRRKCAGCGETLPTEHKLYCSMKCVRRRSIRNCDHCQKQFEYKTYDIDRRFCSNACYKRSNSETSIEKIVREFLESKDVVFKTQVAFKRYVIDFLLPEIGLIIEADGSYWHSKKSVKNRDIRRDQELNKEGFKVLRLTEKEIKNGQFINQLIPCLN